MKQARAENAALKARIGTLSAWLWVFTNRPVTVYTIKESRGHDVGVEILGKEFAGILASD